MRATSATLCLVLLCLRAAPSYGVDPARANPAGANLTPPVITATVAAPVAATAPLAYVAATAPLAYVASPNQVQGPKLISVSFRDSSIQEAFQMLAQGERLNILLRKGISGKVSVNLYDVSVPEAIKSIAEAGGYAVEQPRPGEYLIMERKDAGLESVRGETRVKTYKVQYSNPKSVADILTKYLSRYGKITPLPERNLLVVEDLPEFHQRIEKILREIDIEPLQIMIEAKILEITLDNSESFGIDWNQVVGAGGSGSVGVQGLASRGAPGFFFGMVNKNLNLYLNALSAKGRVHTLSTPKLLALENQEATVKIGDSLGYKVTTTINLVTTESVQYLDTGVILKVVPSVDERGLILMKIHPEVSSGSLANGVPSKKSTEVTTQLLAEDGQSILVGGLIKNSTTLSRNGVPVLGDLPGVGWLFSNKEEGVHSTETVVMITPHVMRRAGAGAAAASVTPERVQRMEQQLFRKQARELEQKTGAPAGDVMRPADTDTPAAMPQGVQRTQQQVLPKQALAPVQQPPAPVVERSW
ncbi:MAG: type II secretion system protein GspD [Burkholderiales bacterium]